MSQDIRSILYAGYSFVRSIEENKAIASITMDHLIQDYITSIKQGEVRDITDAQGNTVNQRTSRYDQLSDLLTSFNNAIQAIQDAGDDPGKLAALGIFGVDSQTVSNSDQSTNAASNAEGG